MKRRGWILITMVTVLLTGLVLMHAGRLGLGRSLRASPRHVELRGHVRASEALISEAAFHWRCCQHNHWRACLLQQ